MPADRDYFKTSLNYTLANEDTALEYAILPEGVKHVCVVAGSGSRVLPLLAKRPQQVTCVDLSAEQLYLTELRVAALRALSHAEYAGFWGYPPHAISPEERRSVFERLDLTPSARRFLARVFEESGWGTILYRGRWERTFAKMSRVIRALVGRKGVELFQASRAAEHFTYIKEVFPGRAWSLALFLLGNATVFNALLYRGSFPKKNLPESFHRFYRESFDRIFSQGPARENFFLQLVFFGELRYAEGLPFECEAEVYAKARAALGQIEVRYVQGDAIEVARQASPPIEFLSLSNIPSYFSGDREGDFLERLRPGLAPGGQVVFRSYLRVPEGLRTEGYEEITARFAREIEREKVQVYLPRVFRRR